MVGTHALRGTRQGSLGNLWPNACACTKQASIGCLAQRFSSAPMAKFGEPTLRSRSMRNPFKKDAKPQSITDIGNVPQTAYDRAKAEWAERMGESTVNQGRLFVLAIGSIVGMVALAVALAGLAPLKSVVPYSIQVDKITGETRAVGITATTFNPDEKQKRFFLAKWVKQMLTLDAFTTERDLSDAYAIVRGKAIDEFREYLAATQPISKLRIDTTLTRSVQPSTIQFIGENIAMIRVVTQTRSANSVEPNKRYAILVHFAIEPPKSEAEILRNPIGMFVTHFTISEELT